MACLNLSNGLFEQTEWSAAPTKHQGVVTITRSASQISVQRTGQTGSLDIAGSFRYAVFGDLGFVALLRSNQIAGSGLITWSLSLVDTTGSPISSSMLFSVNQPFIQQPPRFTISPVNGRLAFFWSRSANEASNMMIVRSDNGDIMLSGPGTVSNPGKIEAGVTDTHLIIRHPNPGSNEHTFGPRPTGSLTVAPNSQDFGEVVLQASEPSPPPVTRTFTLGNDGNDCVHITAIEDVSPYEISSASRATLPLELDVGESAPVDVVFAPTTTGDNIFRSLPITRNPPNGANSLQCSGDARNAPIVSEPPETEPPETEPPETVPPESEVPENRNPEPSPGEGSKKPGERMEKTIHIEANFITYTKPKVCYLDLKSDPYRDEYGPLVHHCNLHDHEMSPNIVMLGLKAGVTEDTDDDEEDVELKDRIIYVDLFEPVAIEFEAHGLVGELFVGEDGEITDTPPNTYRRIHVGSVIDEDTVIFRPANESFRPAPNPIAMRASLYDRVRKEDVTAISLRLNGGSVELHRANSIHRSDDGTLVQPAAAPATTTTPSLTDLRDCLFDLDNNDVLHFSHEATGIDITFGKSVYISDLDVGLWQQTRWFHEFPNRNGIPRNHFDVKCYTRATDTTPIQVRRIWDRANGPVGYQGINFRAPGLHVAAEKIRLEWPISSRYTDWSPEKHGALRKLHIWSAPYRERLTLVPQRAKIADSPRRIEVAQDDKLLLYARTRSTVVDWNRRVGLGEHINECYRHQMFGLFSNWHPDPDDRVNPHDESCPDERFFREWWHVGGHSGKANTSYRMISLDMELKSWIMDGNESPANQRNILDRWRKLIGMVRRIAPNTLIGIYTHPRRTFTANDFVLAGPESNPAKPPRQHTFARAQIAESLAEEIYDMCDVMLGTIYQIGKTPKNWITTLTWQIEQAHQRGRLFFPHWSFIDYAQFGPLANFRNYLDNIWRLCDGVCIWDHGDDQQRTYLTEEQENEYAEIMRAFFKDNNIGGIQNS